MVGGQSQNRASRVGDRHSAAGVSIYFLLGSAFAGGTSEEPERGTELRYSDIGFLVAKHPL